jgi:carbamoyltransferase
LDEGTHQKELEYSGKIIFPEHHESHALRLSSVALSEAAFLTVDGVGEWTTNQLRKADAEQIEMRSELHFPHSLGLLYSAFTYFTGFGSNSGEYKLMGLGALRGAQVRGCNLRELLDLKEDGSFRLNMRYFNYGVGLTMTTPNFERLFGGPPRKPESRLTQRDMDLARSIQDVTEEVHVPHGSPCRQQSGMKNLCLLGASHSTVVANGRILRERVVR